MKNGNHKNNPFPFRLIEKKEDSGVFRDRLPYCKTYADVVDVALADGIGVNGLKMLFVLMRVMLRNKEHVFLSYDMYEAVVGKKKANKNKYYKGMSEIISLGVIARSTTANMYWINTNYIFKGDRTKMLKDKQWANGMFNT